MLLGIAEIYLGSNKLMSNPGATLDIGGDVLTEKAGHRVHGYVRAIQGARLSCTVSADDSVSIDELRRFRGPVRFVSVDTKHTFEMPEMLNAVPPVITDGSGDITLQLMGAECNEKR